MKSLISLVLVFGWGFCEVAKANSVVIYHSGRRFRPEIEQRLNSKYGIPKRLIANYLVNKCPEVEKSRNKLVLCAKRKELEVLNSNSSIIKSFAVFRNEAE